MISIGRKLQTCLAILPLMASSTSWADPVLINVTGKLITAACTVDSSLSGGHTIDLGTSGRTDFLHAGETGEWKRFTLNLFNCPANTLSTTATFSGTPDSNDNLLFANNSPSLTAAKNIAVQVVKDDERNVTVSNNSTLTVSVDSNHNATFPLAARLITPTGEVRPGTIMSTVLVNFTYQ